jgi:SpoVK/Ycf46/Vps4 family AAA+-type ATPase
LPAEGSASHYANSLEHLLAELDRLQLLVRSHIKSVQNSTNVNDIQGLVITDQEVQELLDRPSGTLLFAARGGTSPQISDIYCRLRDEIALRKAESRRRGIHLRLARLEERFHLSPFDVDCILICLASEVDARYDRLYAYLQDDVTKRRPSVDLLLNLLCPLFQDKLVNRLRLLSDAPLVHSRLLVIYEDPTHHAGTLLNKFVRIDERVVNYLVGSDEPDAQIASHVHLIRTQSPIEGLVLPEEIKTRLEKIVAHAPQGGGILYLHGPRGTGKKAVAAAVSDRLGAGLLIVDLAGLLTLQFINFQTALRLVAREALLLGAALYFDGIGLLFPDDKQSHLQLLCQEVSQLPILSFLAGEDAWEPVGYLRSLPFIRVEFPQPCYADRVRLWERALENKIENVDVEALANKFRFSGGQIMDAAASAKNLARSRGPQRDRLTQADLNESCRLHSSRKLSTVGRRVKAHHTWNDIVLPEDRLQQLREICNSMKFRALVFDTWGFDRKLSLGKGLNMLFAGPSGTGKTMAAEIMAGELGLDLYKIDLSTVVSKYIGETEKNLARIFAEAESSDAILFFDEADALFGRRSEVRDSHDRYANIEINYLLQKMEEHEGVVILATNFRKNMDDAFVRRMHFTVDFPFPGERERRQIWERIWPEEMPQGPDLDLESMARRFEMAGGNIRNVATAAAFLAASDGVVVGMSHLIHGTRREFQKMGKVVVQGEFE